MSGLKEYVIGIRRTSQAPKVYLRAVVSRCSDGTPEQTVSIGPRPQVRLFNPGREYLIPIPAGAPTEAVGAYIAKHGTSSADPYFFLDSGQKGIERVNAEIGLSLVDPRHLRPLVPQGESAIQTQPIPDTWMVRSKGGKLFQTFLEKGIVALGGHGSEPSIGDIGQYDTFDALQARVWERRPDKSPSAAAYTTRVLFLFSQKMHVGDWVITDNPAGWNPHYVIGMVTGEYRYEASWALGLERYSHVRSVQWGPAMVAKSDLPSRIRGEFGKRPSIYELSREAAAWLSAFLRD